MKTTSSLKRKSLVLCFLAVSLARADAQTPNNGTQIIGYNNSNDLNTITNLTNSPYTTFIDGFLQFTNGSTASNPALGFDTLSNGPTLNADRVAAFNNVEGAGKNVLLSFGGAGAGSLYANFATAGTAPNGHAYSASDATQTLANVLAAYVTGASSYVNMTLATNGQSVAITTYDNSRGTFRGFSGIDLDFEDTQSFQNGGTYNGTQFVSQLTLNLRAQLGGGYLITQAPQTPYLDAAFTKGNGSYASTGGYSAIFANGYNTANPTASAAGNATNWLNVQFYNNPGDDGNNTVGGVVSAFEKLVTDNPGISPGKFVLTLPINQVNANDNFFTPAEVTQIVSQINAWLKSNNLGSIRGVAGFELFNAALYNAGNQGQMDANNLAFANAAIAGVPEPPTWAFVAGGVMGLGWIVRRKFAAGC